MDDKTQKELNKPLQVDGIMDDSERAFLEMLVGMVNEGKIDLHKPSTLLNDAHYDALPTEKKGEADIEAVNMLSTIREIKDLHDAGYMDSYQMINLVERLKAGKERLEEEGGDLFII